jgi:hypothetical protein
MLPITPIPRIPVCLLHCATPNAYHPIPGQSHNTAVATAITTAPPLPSQACCRCGGSRSPLVCPERTRRAHQDRERSPSATAGWPGCGISAKVISKLRVYSPTCNLLLGSTSNCFKVESLEGVMKTKFSGRTHGTFSAHEHLRRGIEAEVPKPWCMCRWATAQPMALVHKHRNRSLSHCMRLC